MSFRTTYILFGLLIAQIIFFALLQVYGPVPGDDLWLFPKLHHAKPRLKAENFNRVEVVRHKPKEEKLVLVRDAETKQWRMLEPYQTRVESHLVNQLVDDVQETRRQEASLARGLAEYDLDPPSTSVTLTTDQGETVTLNLGKSSVLDGNPVVFVTSSERPSAPLAVRRNSIDQVFKSAKELRSPHGLAESGLAIASLKLNDGKNIVALKKSGDVSWELVDPPFGPADYDGEPSPPGAEKKKISGVRELTNTVEGLRVQYSPEAKPPIDDYVAENVAAKELEEKYGLGPKPATLRIEGEVGTGSAFGVKTSDKTVKDALLIGKKADEKGDKYYARLESEKNVVRLSAKGVEPLLELVQSPGVLRDKDLLKLKDESKVDAIDIVNASGTIQLRRPPGKSSWQLLEDGKLRDADSQQAQGLLNMLTLRRQVKAFPTEPDAELGLDDKERAAVVSVWENGLDSNPDKKGTPELKSPTPTVKLVFGKKDKDGKLVYVKREAGKDAARLAVNAGLLDRVGDSRLAYLEKTIPSFPMEEEVVKLTIERDGKTWEVEKEKRGDTMVPAWKFLQPPELAGRLADEFKVRNVVSDLRLLKPARFAAEKADPKQLADWKLVPPESKAIITTRQEDKDKKEERKNYEYQFGRAEKDGGIYGKRSDGDLVFLVRPDNLAGVRGELVETRVFSFDPAQVKQLKLVAGKQTVELARKADQPGEWVVQNKLADFVPKNQSIDTLVQELSRLNAERFLSFKKPPQPQHGLGNAERSFFIEMMLDAPDKKGAPPLTLTVGKFLENENGYAAQSSNLPGDVFLLPPVLCEPIAKRGINYLNVNEPKEEKKPEGKKDEKKPEGKKQEKKPEPAPKPK